MEALGMAFWVVRAGKHGEQEKTAIEKHLVCHGWNELPNYSGCKTKDQLRELYVKAFPDESEKKVSSGLGQVWRFAKDIQIGDLVALPLKSASSFMFGKITGEYQCEEVAPNVKHIRQVKWIKAVPRSAFPKDILFSMNSALTIFKVYRHEAEERVKKILSSPVSDQSPATLDEDIDEIAEGELNLEQTARDEILKFVQTEFKGHKLARLIDAILRAQGYITELSPPGPDGGVDILAGSGLLGLDQPRLCVQVKSGAGTEGQKTYNELLGVVSKFSSQQGLLVSWGGFTNPVWLDARKDFFKIRLWDQGNVVEAVLQNYDRLDDDIKAEISLKRIWVLVKDEVKEA
jgi:restriction system protein